MIHTFRRQSVDLFRMRKKDALQGRSVTVFWTPTLVSDGLDDLATMQQEFVEGLYGRAPLTRGLGASMRHPEATSSRKAAACNTFVSGLELGRLPFLAAPVETTLVK